MPAWWSVAAPNPAEGTLGVTAATHAGELNLDPALVQADGTARVEADSAADAVAHALTGAVRVTLSGQTVGYRFTPGAAGSEAPEHRPFLLTDDDDGTVTVALEDMAGWVGSDWDYDDRSWAVTVEAAPVHGGGAHTLGAPPGGGGGSGGDHGDHQAGSGTEDDPWILDDLPTGETASVWLAITEEPNDYMRWTYTVTNVSLSTHEQTPGMYRFSLTNASSSQVDPQTMTSQRLDPNGYLTPLGWVGSAADGVIGWQTPDIAAGPYLTIGQTAAFSFRTPDVPVGAGRSEVGMGPVVQPDDENPPPSHFLLFPALRPLGKADVPVQASVAVEYRPENSTGDLTPDNPSGKNTQGQPDDTPEFKGGWRFFPDAKEYDNGVDQTDPGYVKSRAIAQNFVRVRATTSMPNTDVFFRSFDVDDPSDKQAIDTDGNGMDNRGKAGDTAGTPTVSANKPESVKDAGGYGTGYQGRLRQVEVGKVGTGAFGSAGRIVMVRSNDKGFAEVDLATSFNPGDNYRVVASLSDRRLEKIDDKTGVPTVSAATGPKIPGYPDEAATDQLSVWRRLHVEKDRMAPISWTKPISGTIANPVQLAPQADNLVAVTITPSLPSDGFRGGNLWDEAGHRFRIDRVEKDSVGQFSRVVLETGGVDLKPGAAQVSQGDVQSVEVTSAAAFGPGTVILGLKTPLDDSSGYDGGILVVDGTKYHISINRPQDIIIISDVVPQVTGKTAIIYEDDFTSAGFPSGNTLTGGRVGNPTPVNAGTTVVTLDMPRAATDQFAGGFLFDATNGQRYPVVSNTAGPNAAFTITVAAAPTLHVVLSAYTALQGGDPYPLVTPHSDTTYYDKLQATTKRGKNRLADMYIQPEYNALTRFASNDVTPVSHASNIKSGSSLFDDFRGKRPGTARDADYETPVFWSVHVVSAYEPFMTNDEDVGPEKSILGLTIYANNRQTSLIFNETLRDEWATKFENPVDQSLGWDGSVASITVHEVGHQLIKHQLPDDGGEHRVAPQNIMGVGILSFSDTKHYFYDVEVRETRGLVDPP